MKISRLDFVYKRKHEFCVIDGEFKVIFSTFSRPFNQYAFMSIDDFLSSTIYNLSMNSMFSSHLNKNNTDFAGSYICFIPSNKDLVLNYIFEG